MSYTVKPIEKLARELSRLPGVGLRTATRLAFHLVEADNTSVDELVSSLQDVKKDVHICPTCFGYSSVEDECDICSDGTRLKTSICVVQRPQDIFVMERGDYSGMYHVLNGVISPLDGVGPDDIRLTELFNRIKSTKVEEVIIALNPSVEGDATTLFIAKNLSGTGITVTRLARGVPAGANIDYIDDLTLCRAIEERQAVIC
ncbi:MAG: recombination mediator RecR [Pseudomonadota bacterium]